MSAFSAPLALRARRDHDLGELVPVRRLQLHFVLRGQIYLLFVLSLAPTDAPCRSPTEQRPPAAQRHDSGASPVPNQNAFERREETRRSLRLLDATEVTPAISGRARQILLDHRGSPLGHEVAFELDGRSYVARLEQHFRPPSSTIRPVGAHVGVTVYALE